MRLGHFDSWEIVDENTAIKTCDKSFFAYNGSGVPKEICWFFEAEGVVSGTPKILTFVFNSQKYTGRLVKDIELENRINDIDNKLGVLVYGDAVKNTDNFKVITEEKYKSLK